VSIDVLPVNDPPTADPQAVSTPEDTALAITLTGGDVDGDALSFAIATGPTHGVLTGTPPAVTYTPAVDYHGPDSFSFTTTDGVLSSAPALVTITVTPVNDVPLAVDDSATTPENTAVSIAVLANDALGDQPTTITSVTHGASGSVTIEPGATSVTYTPDPDTNGPDSFTYTITDFDLETSTATVAVTVEPALDPVLTISNGAVTEPNTGTTVATLVISVSEPSPVAISVGFATLDGSAVAGLDYVGAAGTLIIPPLATSYDLGVDVVGDLTDEPDETFSVELSSPVGATLGDPATAVVTIFDNDPMPAIVATDETVIENATAADVAITLNAVSGYDVSVDYATADGSAVAPADYTSVIGVAIIVAGATSTSIQVPLVDDAEIEADELFRVELSNPSNAVLTVNDVTVTIVDDDGCDTPGDADGSCTVDTADVSLIVALVADPLMPYSGDPDCDGSGGIDAADVICAVELMLAY
jgi:hypothetical protein